MLSSSLSVRETKVCFIASRVPTIRRGLGSRGAVERLSLTLIGPKDLGDCLRAKSTVAGHNRATFRLLSQNGNNCGTGRP
jgi:hypothetical protein